MIGQDYTSHRELLHSDGWVQHLHHDPVWGSAQFNAAVQALVGAGYVTQDVASGAESLFYDCWGKNGGQINITSLNTNSGLDEIQVTCSGTLYTDKWYETHNIGSGPYTNLSEFELAVAQSGANYGSEVAMDNFASNGWGSNWPPFGAGTQNYFGDEIAVFHGLNLMVGNDSYQN